MLECPSQGTSTSALTRARRRIDCRSAIERTTPAIKGIHAPVNIVAVSPILEIGLWFVLRFLGFLGASKIPLNSINRHVNREFDIWDFGEELMALQGSLF